MKRAWSRRRVLSALGTVAVAGAVGGLLAGCKHEKLSAQRVIQIGGPRGEFVFVPDRLRIRLGETVTWIVQSGGHTVTAYHPTNHSAYQSRIPLDAEPWDSELLLEKGATFSWTFDREGVYNYFCRPHESLGMAGAIIVGRALDGPGLALPQAELPALARKKLEELIAWAKSGAGL